MLKKCWSMSFISFISFSNHSLCISLKYTSVSLILFTVDYKHLNIKTFIVKPIKFGISSLSLTLISQQGMLEMFPLQNSHKYSVKIVYAIIDKCVWEFNKALWDILYHALSCLLFIIDIIRSEIETTPKYDRVTLLEGRRSLFLSGELYWATQSSTGESGSVWILLPQ